MVPIADIEVYTNGMKKGMQDKLWFLDKIPFWIKNIYDFGCADGSLLKSIHEINPNFSLIGYDPNDRMIEIAKEKNPGLYLCKPMKKLRPYTLINCSSVFHEIHSYGTVESIAEDYDNIFNVGADYIAIRDMFYSEDDYSFILDDAIKLYDKADKEYLKSFSSEWGEPVDFIPSDGENVFFSISINQKEFLHYLLNYIFLMKCLLWQFLLKKRQHYNVQD